MGDVRAPPPGPLIPGSGNYQSLQTDDLNVNDLEVENLTAVNSIFTHTEHSTIEVTSLLNANSVVVTGTVDMTQAVLAQLVINVPQSVDGEGFTQGIYVGLGSPYGDKLLYKAPSSFYQLLTPITGTISFVFGGSQAIDITDSGLINADTRLTLTQTSNDGTIYNFVVTRVVNTLVSSNVGNGKFTVTIKPPVVTGPINVQWHLDGRLTIL